MSTTQKYALVDCISQFRTRYVVRLKDDEQPEHIISTVAPDTLQEFSQLHLGEVPISARPISQKELVSTFRHDNDYLSGWSDDDIMNHIRSRVDARGD